jgi:predicted Zn-dependent protease
MMSFEKKISFLLKLRDKLSNYFDDVRIIYFFKKGYTFDLKEKKVQIEKNIMFNDDGYVIIIEHKGTNMEVVLNSFNIEQIESTISEVIETQNMMFKREEKTVSYEVPCIRDNLRIFKWNLSVNLIYKILLFYRMKLLKHILDCIEDIWKSRIYLEEEKNLKFLITEHGVKLDENVWYCLSEKIRYKTDDISITKTFSSNKLLEAFYKMYSYNNEGLLWMLDNIKEIKTEVAPGKYECICDSDVTGFIIHEVLGHSLEGDIMEAQRTKLKSLFGNKIASELVTILDAPRKVCDVATFYMDDCGNDSCDVEIVKNGILISQINSMRRESFRRQAYPRMSNTYMLPGSSKLSEMIASIEEGFLLTNPSFGQEDPEKLYIYITINLLYQIKGGKLTGKVFKEAIICGDGLDILQNVSMISDGIELCGGGFCRKGNKERLKVSCGGPYIKTIMELR